MNHVPSVRNQSHGGVRHILLQLKRLFTTNDLVVASGNDRGGTLSRRYDMSSVAADGNIKAEILGHRAQLAWVGSASTGDIHFLTISGTGLGAKVFFAKAGRASQLEIGEMV